MTGATTEAAIAAGGDWVLVLAASDRAPGGETHVAQDRSEVLGPGIYHRPQAALPANPDDGDPPRVVSQEEVDHVGQLEPGRWSHERQPAGWSGRPCDAAPRTPPLLVASEELHDAAREIERQLGRMLPDILADAVLLLRRSAVGETATGRSA